MADYDKLKDGHSQADDLNFQTWGKKDVTYKDIILRQFEFCRVEGSKQKVSGGKFYIRGQDGSFNQIELFDQRRVYIQCVLTLHDLMLRYFDDKIKNQEKAIKKDIEDKRAEIWKNYIKAETGYNKTQAQKTNTIQKTPLGNQFLEWFENFRYEKHRELFQQLILLFDRRNEFSGKKSAAIYK